MKNNEVKNALIELYLSLNPSPKINKSEESEINSNYNRNDNKKNESLNESNINNEYEERKLKLSKKSELCLISYIKNSFETLIQLLVEEKVNNYNERKENQPQEYETLLIKLEKEIRSHIQIEQQLKLFIESLQNNFEDLEKENIILKNKLKIRENYNGNNIEEKINELKNEIETNKKVLKSYENQNLKLSENERKLKSKLINDFKSFNEKENKYIQEIDSLKKKISNYEKNLNMEENIYKENSSNPYRYIEKNDNKIKNDIQKKILNNRDKNIYVNSHSKDKNRIAKKYKTNKNDNNNNNNNNRQNGPALSASSSMEKIERYLMNKFAKTQLQFKSKINIVSSASKNLNKNISSPYNNSMIEKGLNNGFYSYNNKLQMNDSALNNIPTKQKKKINRQKSVENNSKLIRNKNKQESILKNILMSHNNSVKNINAKKTSIKNSKGKNNSNYKKVPYTCSLKGKIRNTGGNKNNYGTGNNINYNGKIINNNINIYAHTLRQDNHNVYIKGNNEKSLHSSLRGISGNSSARDYNKYNNELFSFRKNSLGRKK